MNASNPSLHLQSSSPRLVDVDVASNEIICNEHYRLTVRTDNFPHAQPGQFLHVGPPTCSDGNGCSFDSFTTPTPLLRRAFSIAGLRRTDGQCELDVIYRVVGTATTWMASLRLGDRVSIIGPLGNAFPIDESKAHAWMVAGGVGLPPMLWLAEALNRAKRKPIAFVGARSADLLALTVTDRSAIDPSARAASLAAAEFTVNETPVVISTDDGSIGLRGFAPDALGTYLDDSKVPPHDIVVYTCGPERMMESVARICIEHDITCHVCMERSMACGMGTCQSCVVAVGDSSSADGWRYELCCTDGPVFDAGRVIWSQDSGGGVQQDAQRGS